MRLNSVRMKGIGSFREEVFVDFDALGDAKLVAVTGRNGEGKTLLLETAVAGACYRKMPSQGTLTNRAITRDAFVESKMTNGSSFILRHNIDGVSRGAESLVFDGDRKPLIDKPDSKGFKAWIEKHVPPPELLFASIFGAQGSDGFAQAMDGDRKAIILRAKGVEQYEQFAKAASESARETRTALDVVLAKIEEAEKSGNVAQARADLEVTEEQATQAEAALEQAKAALANATTAAEAWRAAKREREEKQARLLDIRGRRDKAKSLLADLEPRLVNNRTVLADADRIRAAETRHAQLGDEIAAAKEATASAEALVAAARAELRLLREKAKAAGEAATKAQALIERDKANLRDEHLVDDAEARLPGLREKLVELQGELRAARSLLKDLGETRFVGATERITRLRSALAEVEEDAGNAPEIAHHALAADDTVVRTAELLPGQAAEAEETVRAIEKEVLDAQREITTAEQLTARRAGIAEAKEAIARSEGEREEQTEIARVNSEKALDAEVDLDAHAFYAKNAAESLAVLRAEDDGLAPLLTRAKALETAQARIAELEPQVATAKATVAELDAQIAPLDLDASKPLPEPPAVDAAREAVEAQERKANDARTAVARSAERLAHAEAQATSIAEHETERRRLEGDLADWTLLTESLGRNGLQAAETDAAGPELTELTNDLLRCYGTRFTAKIETQRLSADGKKMIEGCGFTVIDSVKGTEKDARDHSGGERVILGEAASLALAMMSCRASGVRGVTLVRDESGAALDPENARVYVDMLRRAADRIGASRILFVSHSAEVQALADARIHVEDGKVTVLGAVD